jgi:hypothetical protein
VDPGEKLIAKVPLVIVPEQRPRVRGITGRVLCPVEQFEPCQLVDAPAGPQQVGLDGVAVAP